MTPKKQDCFFFFNCMVYFVISFAQGKVGLVREVFDSFLNVYPYCYGYWKKYADFEKKKSTNEMAAHV